MKGVKEHASRGVAAPTNRITKLRPLNAQCLASSGAKSFDGSFPQVDDERRSV